MSNPTGHVPVYLRCGSFEARIGTVEIGVTLDEDLKALVDIGDFKEGLIGLLQETINHLRNGE